MKEISVETGNTYGKRRMRKDLNARGIRIGLYKTAKLMKKGNIVAIKQ